MRASVRRQRQGVEVGGAVTLARLERFAAHDEAGFKGKGKNGGGKDAYKARALDAVHAQLRWFASNQIRNVASLAGNLATASPISDMNPVLVALGATATVAGVAAGTGTVEERRVPARSFFLGYRRVDLKPHEVITAITLPLPRSPFEFVQPYKQARRREDDISIVTGCIRVRLAPRSGGDGWVVEEAGLGFGGMAPTTVAAPQTEAFLQGKVWCQETVSEAARLLREEDLPLPAQVPGGQAEYRRTLPPSFLLKFFIRTSLDLAEMAAADKARASFSFAMGVWGAASVCVCAAGSTNRIEIDSPHLPPRHPQSLPPAPAIPEAERSAGRTFLTEPKPSSRGEQRFTAVRQGDGLQSGLLPVPHAPAASEELAKGRGAVGKPIPHKSALTQVRE